MKRRNKKKNYFMLLLLLLIGLGIGYAFLTQELTINGTGKVTASSWHVYFDNLVLNQNNVTLSTGDVDAEIDDITETDITYTVTLKNPGDFYEFTVDVVNDGTIDAMIGSVTSTLGGVVIDSEHPLPSYLNYSVTYSDGGAILPNHLLEQNTSETYKVRLEFKTDITSTDLPATDQSLTLTFSVEYVQADSNAIERPPLIQLPQGRTKDNLQTGDEICINGATQECFNFVRYDVDDIVLLAKYNLKVGRNAIYNSDLTYSAPYTSSDTGYGLQDSTMRGYVNGESIRNGVVAFSYTNYWYDGSALKAKYGSAWDTNNIYDTDYITAPDFSTTCDNSTNCFYTNGYSIAYYVEQYKNTLMGTGYGAPIKEARLLTYEEATDSSIGCNGSSCPTTGFITNTTFWLGSASGNYGVWAGYSDGTFRNNHFSYGYYFGVRPVITISKFNI